MHFEKLIAMKTAGKSKFYGSLDIYHIKNLIFYGLKRNSSNFLRWNHVLQLYKKVKLCSFYNDFLNENNTITVMMFF